MNQTNQMNQLPAMRSECVPGTSMIIVLLVVAQSDERLVFADPGKQSFGDGLVGAVVAAVDGTEGVEDRLVVCEDYFLCLLPVYGASDVESGDSITRDQTSLWAADRLQCLLDRVNELV